MKQNKELLCCLKDLSGKFTLTVFMFEEKPGEIFYCAEKDFDFHMPNNWSGPKDKFEMFREYEDLLGHLSDVFHMSGGFINTLVSEKFEGEGRDVVEVYKNGEKRIFDSFSSCFTSMFGDDGDFVDRNTKDQIEEVNWKSHLEHFTKPYPWSFEHVWMIARFGEFLVKDVIDLMTSDQRDEFYGESLEKVDESMAPHQIDGDSCTFGLRKYFEKEDKGKILECFDVSPINSFNEDGDETISHDSYLLLVMKYRNYNPEGYFVEDKNFSNKEVLVRIVECEHELSMLGARLLESRGEVDSIIGLKVYKSKKEARKDWERSIEYLKTGK